MPSFQLVSIKVPLNLLFLPSLCVQRIEVGRSCNYFVNLHLLTSFLLFLLCYSCLYDFSPINFHRRNFSAPCPATLCPEITASPCSTILAFFWCWIRLLHHNLLPFLECLGFPVFVLPDNMPYVCSLFLATLQHMI